ncbi:MAG: hypothetical protein CMJ19_12660 [Phycisphaeraceae bacterium]|nr:hypothetical protein [Phycisphaeraceae bacterium]
MKSRLIHQRYCASLLLLMGMLILCGCDTLGFMVYAVTGPEEETVPAEYKGLENSHFAVIVSADANTLYQSPEASRGLCVAVTREIAKHVPTSVALDPADVIAFTEHNPYWTTMPHDKIIAKLNVDKLVLIDIVQYQIHEKGNANVYKGTAIANVSIADQQHRNTLVYSKVVKATHPVGSAIGMVNADESEFRLALLSNLTTTIGHLFYEYIIIHE